MGEGSLMIKGIKIFVSNRKNSLLLLYNYINYMI